MKPETFLARHPVFSRPEFAAVMRRTGRADATIDAHLTRWRRQGRVVPVKRGVFVRRSVSAEGLEEPVDFVAIASRMAPDAVVAYHTALEVHGVAQSLFERFTYLTWTKAKRTAFLDRWFVPVRPRAPLHAAGSAKHWSERADRSGVEILVTSLERTIADVLDRPGLAGGTEEVWRSLQGVPAVDAQALEEYVALLGSRTLASKVGFFLDARREELVVPTAVIERLRSRIPRAPVFMDRASKGRLVAQWGLIVPTIILDAGEPLR